MLRLYDDLCYYYMHCPAWQILCNPAFVLQYKQNHYYYYYYYYYYY